MKNIIINFSLLYILLCNPLQCFSQVGFLGKSKMWVNKNLNEAWVYNKSGISNDGIEYDSYTNPRNDDEMTFYFNSKGLCKQVLVFTKFDNFTTFSNHFNSTCLSIGFLKWANKKENTYIEFNLDMQNIGLLIINFTPLDGENF